MRLPTRAIAAFLLCLTVSQPAAAYIGPGAGISLMGSVAALLLLVLTSIAVVLIWPIRRLMKWSKSRKGTAESDPESVEPASRP